jgi:hypothetical protein
MEESIEDYKKKVSVLEQKLRLYENDPDKSGFFALKRIVNQQVDYLRNFTIKDRISGKASEDATYARSKEMWESLPKMISELNGLKRELRINNEDEEKESKNTNQRTTPESIADVLGDNKQQQA